MRTLPTEDTDISLERLFHLFIIVFIVLFICSKGINKIKKCILHTHRPPTSQETHNSMPIKTAQNQKIWLPLVVFLYFSEMLPEKLKPKKHQRAKKKTHTRGLLMFGPKRLVLISYISSFIFRCWYVLPSILSLFFTFCLMLHFTRVFGLAMPFGHSRECCNSVYPRKTNFFFYCWAPTILKWSIQPHFRFSATLWPPHTGLLYCCLFCRVWCPGAQTQFCPIQLGSTNHLLCVHVRNVLNAREETFLSNATRTPSAYLFRQISCCERCVAYHHIFNVHYNIFSHTNACNNYDKCNAIASIHW